MPVRIPFGYSIGSLFLNKGIYIDDPSTSDIVNIKRLIRDKFGSAVLTKKLAYLLNAQLENIGKLHIHKHSVQSKSYFIAFSKNADTSKQIRSSIWKTIARLRNNKAQLRAIFSKYKYNLD